MGEGDILGCALGAKYDTTLPFSVVQFAAVGLTQRGEIIIGFRSTGWRRLGHDVLVNTVGCCVTSLCSCVWQFVCEDTVGLSGVCFAEGCSLGTLANLHEHLSVPLALYETRRGFLS